MWRIPHVLADATGGVVKKATALAALSVLSVAVCAQELAQEISQEVVQDSAATLVHEAATNPNQDSAAVQNLDSTASTVQDSAPNAESLLTLFEAPSDTAMNPAAIPATPPAADSASFPVQAKSPLKTVLYLGGGERSPWFHLGVLYAIEEYGIPVDSVVGTSWGAWVGSLWAKGVPLDEIQKLMKDPVIAPYVGHDLSDPTNTLGVEKRDEFELPISGKGVPSMRQRFTLDVDSNGLSLVKRNAYTPIPWVSSAPWPRFVFRKFCTGKMWVTRFPFLFKAATAAGENSPPMS